MPAIDKLTKEQRDLLMQLNITGLIQETVRALDSEKREDLAVQWDRVNHVVVHLVTHAREEVFESRKRVAVIRQAFKGRRR